MRKSSHDNAGASLEHGFVRKVAALLRRWLPQQPDRCCSRWSGGCFFFLGGGFPLIIVGALWFLLTRKRQTGGLGDAISLHSRDQAAISLAKAEKPLATELPVTSKGLIAELGGGLKVPWSEASTLRSPLSPLVEAPDRNGRIELTA
jgi:hypothetical protein